jgi:4-hydroxybenzoate polyprenyltransferase
MRLSPAVLAYLQLLRLPAVFSALSNNLAAQLIATGGQYHWPELSLLLMASAALYLAGMALNDCFDLAEDTRERPGRPLPSGTVPVATAWRLGWGLLAAGILLAVVAGPRTGAIAGLLALAIVLYDGVLKATPVGSLVIGGCRYLNWLLGLAVVPLTPAALLLPLPVLIYVLSLTLLSRVETRADDHRPLGYCAAGLLSSAALLVGYHEYELLPHGWVLLLLIPAMLIALHRLWLTANDFQPARIQQSVSWLILGIIPLDALLVVGAGPWWGGVLVLSLIVPGRLLTRWISIS